jgi:hypothetical protein
MLKTSASEVKDTVDVLDLIRHLVKSAESKAKKGVNVLHGDVLAELSAIANRVEYQAK